MTQTSRRRLLTASAGTLLLSIAPWQIAHGAKMIDVRMWPSTDYTRVTLEHDAPLEFKYFMVKSGKPLRLVVDIKGLVFTNQLKRMIEAVKPDDPYIAGVRIGQYLPDTVRLVMDLKTDVRPEVFLLKPYDKFQYRLVFDIYPAQDNDMIGRYARGEATQDLGPDDEAEASGSEDTDIIGSILSGLTNDTPTPPKAPTTPKAPVAPAPKPTAVAEKKKPTKTPSRPVKKEPLIIVVDPGHGGEDSGAIGRRRTMEKTVVLQIARRLAKLINKEPDMRAVMTRNSDHFVSLGGRVAIARRAKAHLLVSIHADAWVKSSARGSSVFALSRRGATSAAARWLAKNQNASDLIGGVNMRAVDKDVASIVVDMTSSWKIDYSLKLGRHVLDELDNISHLHKGHVEQAGFAVLKGQGIPSILVETGFISNPTEEKLLKSPKHQQALAVAILRGIRRQLKDDPSLVNT